MANESVLQFTDSNFQQEVLSSAEPVLVDFWAEWCGPCRMLAPTIDELALEYKGRIKVGKVDTDANHDTAIKYNINSIPTIILFDRGQIVRRFVGVMPKREFKTAMDALVSAVR
ncbi:MAG: thioredoxin [Phycisphaerae bacterium]